MESDQKEEYYRKILAHGLCLYQRVERELQGFTSYAFQTDTPYGARSRQAFQEMCVALALLEKSRQNLMEE